jgi:chemotaxis signal transduction protein/chemotaxis methyl-accepting protein methylase
MDNDFEVMNRYIEDDQAVDNQQENRRMFADFKMVTFTLGGKEYGVDIMRVKEISKVKNFTHVPNAAPFVRGVYNLRGEIISVIDLRLLFNIPVEEKKEDELENMIVINQEDHVSGIVVDSIDRVVAVNSHSIQDPHPIFSNISVSFMRGVVEFEEKLYVILNMDKILKKKAAVEEKPQINAKTLDSFSLPYGKIKSSDRISGESGSIMSEDLTEFQKIIQQQFQNNRSNHAKNNNQGEQKPANNFAQNQQSRNTVSQQSRPVSQPAPARPVQQVSQPVTAARQPKVVKRELPDDFDEGIAKMHTVSFSEDQDAADSIVNQQFEASATQGRGLLNRASNAGSQGASQAGGNSSEQIIKKVTADSDFVYSDVTRDWMDARAAEYASKGLSASDIESSDEFLSSFYSRCTDKLWEEELIDSFIDVLSNIHSDSIYSWNPGCNQGYESYSIITALKEKFPSKVMKLWANDVDLINVSMAPSLTFLDEEVSSVYKDYMHEEKAGLRFTPEITNLILFEYHDIIHENPYPEMDLIVARDLLSFIDEDKQETVVKEFERILKPGGLLVIGDNEKISSITLKKLENKYLNIYKKDV